jgi:glycosyltransferase involved in cell wall biosynthesis
MPKAIMLHAENSAVGLYRIWMQAKYLEKLGWDIYRLPNKHPEISTDEWEKISEGADIIIAQRTDNPDVIALMMAMGDLRNCPVVYEVDDNIFDVSASSHAYQYFHPGSPFLTVATTFMEAADAVTVSTQGLREAYTRYNPNIWMLKNCQDPEMWRGVKNKNTGDKVVIGWAGSSTHYDDLKLIQRPLKKLLKHNPNVIFRVLGIMPDFLMNVPNVEVLGQQWVDVDKWPKKLASLGFDIGIAPVVHRPFNIGKSNIKWQEYSMLGIPTVASKVGEYCEIDHGVTGFLADSDPAWSAHLERLVRDAELRKTVGEAAKQYTLEHSNIQLNINKWDEAYRAIIKKHRDK